MDEHHIKVLKIFIEWDKNKCTDKIIEVRRFTVDWRLSSNNANDTDSATVIDPAYDSLILLIEKKLPSLINTKYTLSWKDDDGDFITFDSTDELHHAISRSKDIFRIHLKTESEGSQGPVHPDVRCDGCGHEVKGDRFKCTVCTDYDLCHRCQCRGVHDKHDLLCIREPGGLVNYPCLPRTPLKNLGQGSGPPVPPWANPAYGKGKWGFGVSGSQSAAGASGGGARGCGPPCPPLPGGGGGGGAPVGGGGGGPCMPPPAHVRRWMRKCRMAKMYGQDWENMSNSPANGPSNGPNNGATNGAGGINGDVNPGREYKKTGGKKPCCYENGNSDKDLGPRGGPPSMSQPPLSNAGRSRGHPFAQFTGPPWAQRHGNISEDPATMGPWGSGASWNPGREWVYGKEGLGCGNGLGINPRSPPDMDIDMMGGGGGVGGGGGGAPGGVAINDMGGADQDADSSAGGSTGIGGGGVGGAGGGGANNADGYGDCKCSAISSSRCTCVPNAEIRRIDKPIANEMPEYCNSPLNRGVSCCKK